MARHEDSDEDTYAVVGTPFEVLETEEDVQKAKLRKEKEQYVTDAQGRRRFHGAFTGGFSAGYYNTVGSKEGWTPSTFRSSRGTKSEFSGQKPEDFMDDEDLGAHGIAPREVTTRSNFTQKGAGLKRTHPLDETRHDVIPGEAPLQNLIIPAKLSVGARLLRSMGWREGQGVGPRVQRLASGEKMYGCSLPQSITSADFSGPPSSEILPQEMQGFLFAPHDVRIQQFKGKDDLHGIGYQGMEERVVLGGRETDRAVYGMRGEAFGVGALEDDDAEDHVYGVESMTSYNVTLAKDGDVEMERKFGWTGGVEDSWSLASFTKATRLRPKPKVYNTPDVPRDFVPIHRFSILNTKTADGQEQHREPVTVAERNQLLADKPGSVFSLISAADRERLRRVTEVAKMQSTSSGTHSQTQVLATSSSSLLQREVKLHPLAPPKSSSIGDTDVESLKPFARNPLKQARYEAFKSGQHLHSDPESIGMTEWERQREREQFSRISRVYQPLSVSLTSRFTRETEGEEKKKSESPEPDSVQAARANLFGVLTRQVLEWHPHRVLCKRFNIPDPYPNDGLVGTVTEKDKKSSATKRIQFLPIQKAESTPSRSVTCTEDAPHRSQETPTAGGLLQPTGAEKESNAAVGADRLAPETNKDAHRLAPETKKDEIAESRSEIETEVDENKEEARPPMDLFKAIFAESSESSDSEAESQPQKSGLAPQEAAASSTLAVTLNETKRKTRWQDLSAVTSQPPLVTAIANYNTDSKKTTRNVAETVEKDGHTRDRTREAIASEKKFEIFGPILPPDFDNDGTSDVDQQTQLHRGEAEKARKRRDRGSNNSRHRHKHHKTLRNEKQEKIDGENTKESISHRRKEKKKSRPK